MLKVESLEMNKTFCPRDPEVKRGTAELTLGDDAKLTGNFHLENCANGVVACVGLIGNADDTVKGITADKTELKLMGKVVRKVVVSTEGAESAVIKGFAPLMKDDDTIDAADCKVLSGEATITDVEVVVATKPEDSKTTLNLNGAKKGILVVEIPVAVAVGKLENVLAAEGAEHVLEAGECHIDAVVRVADMPNLKPARTSWTVEGAQLRLAKKNEMVTSGSVDPEPPAGDGNDEPPAGDGNDEPPADGE